MVPFGLVVLRGEEAKPFAEVYDAALEVAGSRGKYRKHERFGVSVRLEPHRLILTNSSRGVTCSPTYLPICGLRSQTGSNLTNSHPLTFLQFAYLLTYSYLRGLDLARGPAAATLLRRAAEHLRSGAGGQLHARL